MKFSKRSSLRTKITFFVVGFTACIIIAAWLVCNFLISGVFVYSLKKNLKITYQSCNQLFTGDYYENINNGELLANVKNPIEAIILVFDTDNDRIYTTISNESQMMRSLNDMIKSIAVADQNEEISEGQYVINRNHDNLINADYFDLVGLLDNGYFIILRSPVARVEATMQVINKMFIYITAAMIVFGSVFILLLSNVFSSPIKRLSHAAMRMANLDFDVRIPITTNDEVGELGIYMNAMSNKLEQTISELKAANLELEKDIEERKHIDEMRKEFLSHVSHELKTPIALIQGYAEGIKDNISDDPESMEFYTDVIIDEAQKMNSLVKKLLTLNEIEFGNTPLKIERFELVSFINDILVASKILIEDAKAKLVFEETAPVYVWADEYMIEGVVTNYLTNAIHYVCENGIIRIWFERIGTDVRVSVYNQGNTVSDEDIDKLFIKFYKADKARTREYGGNGIGLSIVAATMEAHGKKYGVYNVADGVVFYFDLDANMLDAN